MIRFGGVYPSLRNIRFFSATCVGRAVANRTQPGVHITGNRNKHHEKVYNNLKKYLKKTKRDTVDSTNKANILFLEIQAALQEFNKEKSTNVMIEDVLNPPELIDRFLFAKTRAEVVIPSVDIVYHTAEGDGVGFIPKAMYAGQFVDDEDFMFNKFTAVVIPKTLVGDKVQVKLGLHDRFHAECLLLQVLKPSPMRRNNLVLCEKFDNCNGCQYQMLRYEDQLQLKKQTMEKAYAFFCPDLKDYYPNWNGEFPGVNPSPLQFAYRSKFTPHYTLPKSRKTSGLYVGYNHVNKSREVVDIDRCDLMPENLNRRYAREKKKLLETLPSVPDKKLGKQSTMYFRESVHVDLDTGETERYCISDHKKVITEQVEDKLFRFESASFFQTNNNILPSVLDYLRYHINQGSYTNLVDTYCGSGFFGISLSNTIGPNGKVFGIEIDSNSIEYAKANAKLNCLDMERVQFIQGSSETMFKSKEFQEFNIRGRDSIVIMDPSRKGSNESFLRQLYEFQPKLIAYVSCNVFTQARDIHNFLQLQKHGDVQYRVRDICGFDFFPQTKQVETIAILELVEETK